MSRILRAMVILLLAAFSAAPAFAQGCVMCYTSAAQAGDAGRSLNRAIVALLVPTLLLFGGVLLTAVRRSDTCGSDDEPADSISYPSSSASNRP